MRCIKFSFLLGLVLFPIFCFADPLVDDLQKKMLEMQAQMEQMKAQLSQQLAQPSLTPQPGDPNTTIVANSNGQAAVATPQYAMKPEDAQAILNNPWVQKFLKLMNHPEFFPSLSQLKDSPNLLNVGYAQLGLIVLMFILRIWRGSVARTWIGKLWVSIYCMVIFWTCSIYFIPAFLLGEPYRKVCRLLWDTFTQA
jgi:hypothetical protein